jgi:hypothetical protein
VITGFNTDVEHEGVTYHVQTEDKGVETPLILSLVYDRGTILASKRVAYDDLLAENFDEKILATRLQKQHKTICAAVRAGRIEELKQMTAKDSAKQKAQKAELKPQKSIAQSELKVERIKPAEPKNNLPEKDVLPEIEIPAPKPLADSLLKGGEQKKSIQSPVYQAPDSKKFAERIDQAKAQTMQSSAQITQPLKTSQTEAATPQTISENTIPKPKQELVLNTPSKLFEGELITGNFEIIEEEPIIEAVQILTDFAKPESPKSDKLQVEFMTEMVFKGGDRKTVSIFVHRGNVEKGISEAQVMVKILGSSFRPLIFHAKTDSNGVATVHLQLPHFRSGRAAILVRAMSGSEEAELRRVVAHG